jgi:hypothetical protein
LDSEYSLTTSLKPDDACVLASDMLASRGFELDPAAIPSTSADRAFLRMRRGKNFMLFAWDIVGCPQEIRLECGKGRAAVAMSIDTEKRKSNTGAMEGISILVGRYEMAKANKEAAELMSAIASSLERLLTNNEPAEQATRGWVALEAMHAQRARKARIRSWLYVVIALAIVVGFLLFLVKLLPHE